VLWCDAATHDLQFLQPTACERIHTIDMTTSASNLFAPLETPTFNSLRSLWRMAIGGGNWEFAGARTTTNRSKPFIGRSTWHQLDRYGRIYGLGHSEEMVGRAIKSYEGQTAGVYQVLMRWHEDRSIYRRSRWIAGGRVEGRSAAWSGYDRLYQIHCLIRKRN